MTRSFPIARTAVVLLLAAVFTVGLLAVQAPLIAVEMATPPVQAPELDTEHALLASVLARVVHDDDVDYATLRDDHAELDRYRVQLATATEPSERAEQLAFYINAYNALTLALVIDRLPEDPADWPNWSIRDAGTLFSPVWKRFSFQVAGRWRTLDAIEHEILRPLNEPRIHFAINCASVSCPPLITEPYRAATLETQLERVATDFARSDYQVRLEQGQLRLNPILDWFSEDFEPVGGVRAFLLERVPAGPVAEALANARLRFFEYDWSLNLHRPEASE
ncbi:MAG: DUF547 domain-containing protein [Planctomycetota bacterium]